MAVVLQTQRPLACRSARQRSVVKCSAGAAPQKLQLAIATAAAASLVAAPAFAGVILAKPELKRVFLDDTPAGQKAAPAPKAAPAKAAESKSESSGEGFSISPYLVTLPGALALVGGGAAVALKADPEWFYNGLMKNSNTQGAGYEELLKTGNGATISVGKTKAGTKMLKKK